MERHAFPDAVISSVSLVKQNVYFSHTPFVVSQYHLLQAVFIPCDLFLVLFSNCVLTVKLFLCCPVYQYA